MKTLTAYKSLLLAGGLLLICLAGLTYKKSDGNTILNAARAEKHSVITTCAMDTSGGSYLKQIAEKLFPVLKSLNIM